MARTRKLHVQCVSKAPHTNTTYTVYSSTDTVQDPQSLILQLNTHTAGLCHAADLSEGSTAPLDSGRMRVLQQLHGVVHSCGMFKIQKNVIQTSGDLFYTDD